MASGDGATVLSRGVGASSYAFSMVTRRNRPRRAKGNVAARLRLAYELFFELNATLLPRLEDVTAASRDKVRTGGNGLTPR